MISTRKTKLGNTNTTKCWWDSGILRHARGSVNCVTFLKKRLPVSPEAEYI